MNIEVLICTHNGEKYLSEQIYSILNQSRLIDKLHIHDYLSADKTRDIILELAETNGNIEYLFFQHANGPSLSFISSLNYLRNILPESSVLFLSDQDDIWLDHKVSRAMEEIENGAEFLFHDVEIVNEHGRGNNTPEYHYGKFWDIERDLVFPDLSFANPVIGHTCAITIRGLRTLDLSESVLIPMHDWYIVTRVLLLKVPYKYIPEVLSLYRQHESNILGKKSPIRALKRIISSAKTLGRYHFYLKKYESIKIEPIEVFSIRPWDKLIYVGIKLLIIKIFKYDRYRENRKE